MHAMLKRIKKKKSNNSFFHLNIMFGISSFQVSLAAKLQKPSISFLKQSILLFWDHSCMLRTFALIVSAHRYCARKFTNLVPRAHVPFGQHQDTELWNN